MIWDRVTKSLGNEAYSEPMTETSLEWTDATWNRVAGCNVISPGCTNCYPMRRAVRLVCDQAWRSAIKDRMAANRHRVYRDRECITALEDFLVRLASSL